MPRKSKSKSKDLSDLEAAPLEPKPRSNAIDRIRKSREAKASLDPERPMPEPDQAAEAVAAFQRQRDHEQAVSEPPARQQKTWAETVRPWTSHGRDTGVHHVTTTSPNMVGIRFDKGKERTAEEKREMEAAGLKFFVEAQSWLKVNRDGAFDETQDLARKFADRRRQMSAEYIER